MLLSGSLSTLNVNNFLQGCNTISTTFYPSKCCLTTPYTCYAKVNNTGIICFHGCSKFMFLEIRFCFDIVFVLFFVII